MISFIFLLTRHLPYPELAFEPFIGPDARSPIGDMLECCVVVPGLEGHEVAYDQRGRPGDTRCTMHKYGFVLGEGRVNQVHCTREVRG